MEIRVKEVIYYYGVISLPDFFSGRNIISGRTFCFNYPRVLQIQVKISFITYVREMVQHRDHTDDKKKEKRKKMRKKKKNPPNLEAALYQLVRYSYLTAD